MKENKEYQVRFNISELKLAVNFNDYMKKHNLEVTPLIYDNAESYTISFSKDALTKLVTYLGAESDKSFANNTLVRLCNSNLVSVI